MTIPDHTIRVMIVDDHTIVRRGIKALLAEADDISVIGEADNGLEAIRLAKQLEPDVILMDLLMPKMDGIEATHQITAQQPQIRVLMLTSFLGDDNLTVGEIIRFVEGPIGPVGCVSGESDPPACPILADCVFFPLWKRVKAAMEVAMRPEISDAELTVVSAAANTARVESFTQCGKETDWNAQAGHFVAKAAVACFGAASPTLAWDAAMQARMARTCETVATGEGTQNREAEEQYRILEDFLK